MSYGPARRVKIPRQKKRRKPPYEAHRPAGSYPTDTNDHMGRYGNSYTSPKRWVPT